MSTQIEHYLNGSRHSGAGHRRGEVYDPATGRVTGDVGFASEADVREAVAVATGALPQWAATTALRRARVMFRFRELLERDADSIVRIITSEHGKTLDDARGELMRGMEVVEFACGIPHLLKGEYSESVGTGVDSWSLRQPVGVCAGITPFNFPVMVPMWMFPVAIACGNAFILKPSEKVPSASLRLAELLTDAGLPPGVFNVVHGDRETVDALLDDPGVSAVSFVGSTPVAEHVYRRASERGKRVQALGGAKNHAVVMPDADIERAAESLVGAAYGSAGERCMAVSVAVAVGEAADPLVERLAARVRVLRIGPGNEPDVEMGPLITEAHRRRVLDYIDIGVEEGSELVVDGRGVSAGGPGFFLGGCLFDRVTASMRIYREEIFGPVLVVVRVPDLAAAIRLVNAHEFGNGAAIFTRDGASAHRFAQSAQAGMIGVNVPIPVPMAFHSFGGWKHSLFGPLHVHGPDGVRFYTRLKTVTGRWPGEEGVPGEFVMPTMK